MINSGINIEIANERKSKFVVIKGQYNLPIIVKIKNFNVFLCIADMHYGMTLKKQPSFLF